MFNVDMTGSVDGNRLWGKELNLPLRFVEWSPDGKLIIFVTLEAEVSPLTVNLPVLAH